MSIGDKLDQLEEKYNQKCEEFDRKIKPEIAKLGWFRYVIAIICLLGAIYFAMRVI